MLPFIQVDGKWYVAVEWRPDSKIPRVLHLRRLTKKETQWLEVELPMVVEDVWARLFPTDEAIQCGAEPPNEDG